MNGKLTGLEEELYVPDLAVVKVSNSEGFRDISIASIYGQKPVSGQKVAIGGFGLSGSTYKYDFTFIKSHLEESNLVIGDINDESFAQKGDSGGGVFLSQDGKTFNILAGVNALFMRNTAKLPKDNPLHAMNVLATRVDPSSGRGIWEWMSKLVPDLKIFDEDVIKNFETGKK